MATIRKREHQDGTFACQAVIRIKRNGRIVHRESRMFWRYRAAVRWARRREVELEDPAMLAIAQAESRLLAELIRWYIDQFYVIAQWQRSKQNALKFLERHEIGMEDVYRLSVSRLVRHVRSRRTQDAGPATVKSDLIYIGVVLAAAQAVGSYPVDPKVAVEARDTCRRLQLIGEPNRRDIRPDETQPIALTDYFLDGLHRSPIPMADIMWFAIYSARRQSEICRLRWTDNDPRNFTGVVRDLKHPRHKIGNHQRFRYTPEGWKIAMGQSRTGEFIFPFKAASIKEAFRVACRKLRIENLRFHDLRHEATSRLFERGYEIHEVQQFTLHSSWRQLLRYTHLRPEQIPDLPYDSPPSPYRLASSGEQSVTKNSITGQEPATKHGLFWSRPVSPLGPPQATSNAGIASPGTNAAGTEQ
jgi:integrase